MELAKKTEGIYIFQPNSVTENQQKIFSLTRHSQSQHQLLGEGQSSHMEPLRWIIGMIWWYHLVKKNYSSTMATNWLRRRQNQIGRIRLSILQILPYATSFCFQTLKSHLPCKNLSGKKMFSPPTTTTFQTAIKRFFQMY